LLRVALFGNRKLFIAVEVWGICHFVRRLAVSFSDQQEWRRKLPFKNITDFSRFQRRPGR